MSPSRLAEVAIPRDLFSTSADDRRIRPPLPHRSRPVRRVWGRLASLIETTRRGCASMTGNTTFFRWSSDIHLPARDPIYSACRRYGAAELTRQARAKIGSNRSSSAECRLSHRPLQPRPSMYFLRKKLAVYPKLAKQ